MNDNWSLIQNGEFEKALKNTTEEYELNGTDFSLRNRAKLLLLLKDYRGALNDYLVILNKVDSFYTNNKNYQDNVINKGDGDYINLGVAYWLLGEYQHAVKMWTDSMTLRLRYTSNIMIPPCIVYFAGVYLKDCQILKEAKKYIKKRYKKSILLGKYLLDEIEEQELLDEITTDSPLEESVNAAA
jgi:tetratricopeptide (TPR) repeat protein